MVNRKECQPILIRVTKYDKDSIVKNNHHFYVESDNINKIVDIYDWISKKRIDSVEYLGDKGNSTYYVVNKPLWGISLICDINNNEVYKKGDNFVSELIEYISPKYSTCGVTKIVPEVMNLFNDKDVNKNGYECRNFIALFSSWSYYCSYAGDGDYGFEYEGIVSLGDLSNSLVKEVEEYDY
jgi:hypothetical protein